MLNGKDDDSELSLGKYGEKCIGECVISELVVVRQKQNVY